VRVVINVSDEDFRSLFRVAELHSTEPHVIVQHVLRRWMHPPQKRVGRRPGWLDDRVRDRIRLLHSLHRSDGEIAAELGCHKTTVARARAAMGLVSQKDELRKSV